jgi:hypothetical protein
VRCVEREGGRERQRQRGELKVPEELRAFRVRLSGSAFRHVEYFDRTLEYPVMRRVEGGRMRVC